MEIIPVIDLLDGVVVHARLGRRDLYRPINTPLCPSSDALAVVKAVLALHPFRTLYVADLNALTGKSPQTSLIRNLAAAHPDIRFWVDAGWPAASGNWNVVIGTESLNTEQWARLADLPRDWILSLDHLDGRYVGPATVLTATARWPERVIAMCLHRVGSQDGPDWEHLERIRKFAPEKHLVAAGGVRGIADLERLESMGIQSALVASALHDGRLTFK